MHTRKLLVLTIAVAVLGGFIFFVEKDMPSTDERKEQEKKVLVLEKDDVQALEIFREGETIRFERRDPPEIEEDKEDEKKGDIFAKPQPEWHLVEPFAARAEKSDVDALISSIASLEKERTVTGAERSDLGLDEPRGKVTIVTEKGETVLEIGPELPASSDMLVAVAGRPEAYQVSDSLWSDLTKDAGDWRAKDLFTASRAEIDRVTLASGDTKVLLARRGESDFWIESPVTDLADGDLVNGLLAEVTGLKAESFVDEPPPLSEVGLEPPEKTLEVVLAGREDPFRLEFGQVEGEGEDEEEGDTAFSSPRKAYARVGEQIVEVRTRLVDSFARTPQEWRSRSWTPIQVFRVDSARLEDSEGPIEVTHADGDWMRGEDRVAYSAVSDVLYAISEAKAEEVVSREEAEARGHRLDAPALSVTLDTEGSSQSLALYPAVEGVSAATQEGREAVLLLGSEAVEEVTSKVAELRKAEPLPDEDEESEDEEAEDPDE